jgi:hypothetical protein
MFGKLVMDSICFDLKAEELWEDLILLSIKMKKELFLQEHLIKANFLFVIGLRDPLIKLAVKMIQ